MRTVEELEALLETVTRERDLSISAWESAGMQGRTAQSAMLKLTRQLEEAQERIELLTELREEERSLNAHFHHEIQAKHTAAEQAKRELEEARAESAKWKAGFEEFRSRNTDLMMQLFEAQEKVRAVNIEPMLHLNAQLRSKVHGLSAEVGRLTDERDELLVRVANQGAELRATREAYRDAYRRGAEAMRDECIGAACGFFMGTQGFCNGDEDELEAVLEALPIPEEP